MADKEHFLQVETEADNYTLYGRPCEISSFSFIPTQRNEPAERTVFNSAKKVTRFDEGPIICKCLMPIVVIGYRLLKDIK